MSYSTTYKCAFEKHTSTGSHHWKGGKQDRKFVSILQVMEQYCSLSSRAQRRLSYPSETQNRIFITVVKEAMSVRLGITLHENCKFHQTSCFFHLRLEKGEANKHVFKYALSGYALLRFPYYQHAEPSERGRRISTCLEFTTSSIYVYLFSPGA